MTASAEGVIAKLKRGLTLWSTTPMMCDVIEGAIATIAGQAAEVDRMREQLQHVIRVRDAEIGRIRWVTDEYARQIALTQSRDPIQCLNCGTFFVPKRTTKKFCSTGRCRQEYHERSKRSAS